MTVCDKTKYGSYKNAQEAIGKIVAKRKKPMRVYKCLECGGFHVATIHHNRKNMLPPKEKYKPDYEGIKSKKEKRQTVYNVNKSGYGNPPTTYKPFEAIFKSNK